MTAEPPQPPPATAARGARTAEVVAVGLIALVLAAAVSGWWFTSVVDGPPPAQPGPIGHQLSAIYDPPADGVEHALNKGDGQVFAAQATDPFARSPEIIRGGPEEQAYRFQRPLYGWVGWVLSGGGARSRVAPALAAATVLATGLLAAAAARFVSDRGRDPRSALLLLLLPGVFVSLTWIGPEVLGLALVVLGLHRVLPVGPNAEATGPVPWSAVAAFAAAGLGRETLLAVPATLAVVALWQRRPADTARLAASAAPSLAWVLYLRWAIGAWPTGTVDGRLSPLPLGGLAEAIPTWTTTDLVFGTALLTLALTALVWGRRSLAPLMAVHLALAATLGEPVWHRLPDFGRVLLPLGALSVLALATRPARPEPASTGSAGGVELGVEGLGDRVG